MTIEQAIEILSIDKDIDERFQPNDSGTHLHIMSLDLAIEVLEKRIPKKIATDEYYPLDKFCPACLENFTGVDTFCDNYERWQYCPSCGQAIDWSEQE